MFFRRREQAGPKAINQNDSDRAAPSDTGPLDFDLLYENYAERIYRYCLRRVGQPQEAEDLASLVFTRAWAALATYRGGSEAAWLFRIAHNAVANHLRGRKPQVSLEALLTTGGASADFLAGPGEEMLDNLIGREDRAELAALVEKLKPDQRELLALSVAGGLTAREVGEVLGKSEAAVWMAFHRLVKRLRAALSERPTERPAGQSPRRPTKQPAERPGPEKAKKQ